MLTSASEITSAVTTVSTALALAPVAYGIGGLDPFLQPAALAVTWGLVCATVLTLIVIPCLYAIEEDIRQWVQRIRRGVRHAGPHVRIVREGVAKT